MYQELLSKEPIASFEEMQEKVEKWIEWYNFKRPHQGIDGLVPADRFFSVEGGVREMMEKGASIVKDALIVDPRKIKKPMYLIGRIGGKEIRVIAKEGSVMVEGLDEVEQKDSAEVNDGRGKEGTGPGTTAGAGNETTTGDKREREVGERTAGTFEEEKAAGSGPGAQSEPGNGTGMEEQGPEGHGKGSGGQGSRPEAEGLCEGRRTEGKSGGYTGEVESGGERESAAGGERKEGDKQTLDSPSVH
jgi:hypothetical protein